MVSIGTRSPVYARHGMVASSQPLASEIGLRILRDGGNAVDAAIAVAAALAVTEPCSTGMGGDCFLLHYDASTKQVRGLNGSGRSPRALTLAKARADLTAAGVDMHKGIPGSHGHSVTVPGAVAGWVDAIETWGSLPLATVLAPAIALAKEGFPVAPITATFWKRGQFQLERGAHAQELLVDGQAPRPGQLFRNPTLAKSLEAVATQGKAGFYSGRIAEAIVALVHEHGGVLALEDLAAHQSQFVAPIKTSFRGVDVHEIPPNGQGITALLALNLLEQLMPPSSAKPMAHNSAEYLHLLIEAMRLAFADANWYVSDLEHHPETPVEELLSEAYAKARATLIQSDRAAIDPVRGSPVVSCDTVSFQVVDGAGNAVSMVNSNYAGFGTGLIPMGCGFPLQNRGSNFVLHDETHPNALAPSKRPYHTIIPALTTFTDSQALHASFTVMGGFMQPQGHVQVLCNLLVHGLNAQEAIDGARFCIDAEQDATATYTNENDAKQGEEQAAVAAAARGSRVWLEDGVAEEVVQALSQTYGHQVSVRSGVTARSLFGRGQIILRDPESGVLSAGSDGRADGCAMGW